MRRLALAIALAATLTTLASEPASAGTYEQFVCKRPDGSWAPTDGWISSSSRGGYILACNGPKAALTPSLPGDTLALGTAAAAHWSSPNPEVRLAAFRIRRSLQLPPHGGPGTVVYRLNSPTVAFRYPDVRELCHVWIGCTGLPRREVTVGGLSGGGISVIVECRDATCDDGSPIYNTTTHATIEAARLTLRDGTVPVVRAVGGSLVSRQPLWGVASLTYRASDIGGGVYRHRLLVNRRVVLEQVVDANRGRCADALPGAGTAYEFDYTVPCAAAVNGVIRVDLNTIGVGTHDVQADVEDAAGNRRTVFAGRIAVVSDPARRVFDAQGVVGLANPLGDRPGLVVNGHGGGRQTSVTARLARRGARTVATFPNGVRLSCRLQNGDRPVSGAVVAILERQVGAPTWRAVQAATTSATGSIDVPLVPGPSRQVRCAYVPDSEASTFVASRSVLASYRPKITLRATPKQRRTGQRVRFTGRVSGTGLPAQGLVVTLQAGSAPSRWITFETVRTGAGGRFKAAYRFTSTRGSVRYRFRAVVSEQAGFPYATGISGSAWVRVRGRRP